MKPKIRELAAAAALLPLLSQPGSAETTKYRNPFPGFDPQCYADVPAIDDQVIDVRKTPVEIFSDAVSTSDRYHVSFTGGVEMTQGNRSLKADITSYDRTSNAVSARGNVSYKDGYITVTSADELQTSLDQRRATLMGPSYILHGSPAHGSAGRADYDDKKGIYHFENARISTCPRDEETWHLTASTVDVDSSEVFGEAWNATLWFHDTPVFYLPYFNFPIKNQRKTGLLYPSLEYSRADGLQIATPFYWNIAPNYDYTLTPTLVTRRGLLTSHEFRYMLAPEHTGSLLFEYINHDRKASRDEGLDSGRWFLRYRHSSSFLDGRLKFDAAYDKVNSRDYNYFNDLGTTKDSSDKLLQNARFTYTPYRFTRVTLEARSYQMLIDTAFKPFATLPRLSVHHTLPLPHLSLTSYAELTRFTHTRTNDSEGNYEGTRLHGETAARIPLVQEPFLQVDGTAKLMFTHYDQDQKGPLMQYLTDQGFQGFDSSVNRLLPLLKFRANLILDTEFSLFGESFSQSLEPHIQYLYVPYKDQDRIGLYDTTDYIQDYYSIFGDNRFAGIDRISNENRLTLGFTSKVYDAAGRQRMTVTLGQAFSLEDQKVGLTPAGKEVTSRSNFNLLTEIRPLEDLSFAGFLAYDTVHHNFFRGFAAAEYRTDAVTGQLNYRYTKQGNRVMFKNEKVDLKQLGAHLALPLGDRFSLMSSMFYDLEQKRNIDRVVKLQYSNCCWKFNVYLEQVNEPDNVHLRAHEDTKFGLQFEMKGLGSLGGRDLEHNLDTRLLPYNRPFNISE